MGKNICKICEREIDSDILYKGDYDQINVFTIWPMGHMALDGHKTCLKNIDKFVVIPNRHKVGPLLEVYLEQGHKVEDPDQVK